jgi:superfamily II DNA or RNA helicase
MRSRQITGCCISHYKRICDGLPFIAFCVSIDHATRVAEDFRGAGYPVEAIDGTLSRDERRRIVQSLGRQNVGITSCDLVSEGFDVPAVVAAILLRPTKSLGLYLQQVGRALRVCQGKTKAVILDCVGNVLKHGLPDAAREWCLTRGVVRPERDADDESPDIRSCPECYAVHEWAAACPYCGHVYVAAAREVKQVAGELKKLTPEEIQDLEEHAKRTGRLKDWHAVAKATGRKSGWAFGKWKSQTAGRRLMGARIG